MAETGNSQLSAQFAAALDWWREAGVDCDFRDAPADWLAKDVSPVPQQDPLPREGGGLGPPDGSPAKARDPRLRGGAAQEEARPAFDPSSIPADLAAFARWWLTEPALDDGRTAGRVAPRGNAGAKVMIVVPEPEREDGEVLLAGPQGRLLEAMLAAMGIAPEETYLASALPRHTPMADWPQVAQRGLGTALTRHVALVAPARLIAFGSNVLPLLGHDPPLSGHFSLQFNQGGNSTPLFAAMDLANFLSRPRAKGRFWQQWLDWMGTSNT